MATSMTRKQSRLGRVDVDDDDEQHGQLVDCFCDQLVDCERGGVVVAAREVSKQVSLLAVESDGNNEAGRDDGHCGGAGGGGDDVVRSSSEKQEHGWCTDGSGVGVGGGRRTTLPPPHAWLAIEDAKKKKKQHYNDDVASSDPEEEQWTRLLRGGASQQQQQQQRRSSFSVVRRERAAREAWLDRAWEMKRSWHERNGGAPDANTPVVVVVGGKEPPSASSSWEASSHHHAGGGGVAMDVEEVRACRDLGLELPSDCTVEIQCYGLPAAGGDSSPTHTAAASSSGADDDFSCAGAVSSPGADPMDVKARLKVWAHAVALTSTTQLSPP